MNITIARAGAWLAVVALGTSLPLASSIAADLPVKAKPIVAAGLDWSGVYIGVHAGYGGGMKDWDSLNGDYAVRGALAGGQVGINKQLGSLVVGVELDGAWADIKGSQTSNFGGPILNITRTQTLASKIDGIATFTGRAGLAADRWFVFAKGGIAMLHETHNLSSFHFEAVILPFMESARAAADEVRYAPTLGFGSEYALGGNWSIKGEYDYIHVNARDTRITGVSSINGPFVGGVRLEEAIHLAKLGVNYRWGGVAIDPGFAPVPPAPGTNWTGGYSGAQGGYAWGSKGFPASSGHLFATDPVSHDMRGWLGGGTIGVNAQAGSFVFGVEGEILRTGIRGSATTGVSGPSITQTNNFDSKIDWLALASARAGFVVGSNLLLYGKGGVAIAQETYNIGMVLTQAFSGTLQASLTTKPVHTGVVAGIGGEYAFAPNWSIKAEYDYVRMFQQQVTADGIINFSAPWAVGILNYFQSFSKINQDLHLFKVGVNYHFNPVQTVAAKY